MWHNLAFNSHSTSFFKILISVLVWILVSHISSSGVFFSSRLKGFWGYGGSALTYDADGVNFSDYKFIIF